MFQTKALPPVVPPVAKKRRHVGGHSFFVLVVGACVIALIAAGLWISVAATYEKQRASTALRQIIDIVDATRKTVAADRSAELTPGEDWIARLEQRGDVKAETSINGFRSLLNPWEGALIAFTTERRLRLESMVPALGCKHIVSLLSNDVRSLGLAKIEIKIAKSAWRQLYTESDIAPPTETTIFAACDSEQPVNLSLTFTIR